MMQPEESGDGRSRGCSTSSSRSRSRSRSRSPETNSGPRRDWTGLRNDAGISVYFGSVETDRMYCDRYLGRNMPGNGRCGPDSGPQCASCRRLQESQRLQKLRARFPSVGDDALVAALRLKGGIFSEAAKHLVSLGAVPEPDDRLTKEMAKKSRLPMAMARVALCKNSCDVEAASAWINRAVDDRGFSNLELCFRAAKCTKQTINCSSEQVPAAVRGLGSTMGTFAPLLPNAQADDDSLPYTPISVNGHWMVPFKTDEGNTIGCVLCSSPLPSDLAGRFRCQACLLCEGCVQSKVVHSCPGLFNGGHLHPHPMKLALERSICAHCDIEGEGCTKNNQQTRHKVTWSCAVCDFDVCPVCIGRPAPDGFDRRVGQILNKTPGVVSTGRNIARGGCLLRSRPPSSPLAEPLDVASVEREIAKIWEGTDQNGGLSAVIVGTGRVGRTFDSMSRRSRTGLLKTAPKHSPTVSILPDEAKAALESYRRRNFEASLSSSESARSPTATNLTLAELFLHQTQSVGEQLTRQKIYHAISGGNTKIPGLLLLSQKYTPSALLTAPIPTGPISSPGHSKVEEKKCWCGDAIDFASAPDGAVGCFQGHAMHPSCAADLLLGGGTCPTCRDSLYLAQVGHSEARAAAKFVDEAKRVQKVVAESCVEAKGVKASSIASPSDLHVGDLVQISSDQSFCAQVQTQNYSSGGWNEADMAGACGLTGHVMEIIGEKGRTVAVRVRLMGEEAQDHHYRKQRQEFTCLMCGQSFPPSTRQRLCVLCAQCEPCCIRQSNDARGSNTQPANTQTGPPSSVRTRVCHEWTFHPSLLSLVQKTEFPPADEEIQGNENELTVFKKVAQQHMMQLRAELVAVKAARENVRSELEAELGDQYPENGDIRQVLSAESSAALKDIVGRVSTADCERAYHLLRIAEGWDDSDVSVANLVRSNVSAMNLESAARLVRRHNAMKAVEAAEWFDAYSRTGEYIVRSAQLHLLAFPEASAPRTGFVLKPRSHFCSEDEFIDKHGNVWLSVVPTAETSLEALLANNDDDADADVYKALVGCRVRRGRDWRHGDQDGGEGNEGVVIKSRRGLVLVRWQGNESVYRYRVGVSNRMEVEISFPSPPPQGWLCVNAKGAGPPLVEKLSGSLKCSCCSGVLTNSQPQQSKGVFSTLEARDISSGDRLLVAATLEDVKVEEVVDGRVYCSFLLDDSKCVSTGSVVEDRSAETGQLSDVDNSRALNTADQNMLCADGDSACSARRAVPIWYRPEDLVYPPTRSEETLAQSVFGEVRIVGGRARTRREVASLYPDDENGARAAWNEARGAKTEGQETSSFASCLRGHLLHTRCFMGALLSGSKCPSPGCSEPLWFPSVARTDDNGTSCRSGADRPESTGVETLDAAGVLPEDSSAGDNRESADRSAEEAAMSGNFRMCPACCSGPFLNENCNDMRAHHGQCMAMALGGGRPSGSSPLMCTAQGFFRASAKDIAERLTHLSEGKTVNDVLPQCPTHKVPVMFNGCASCGHLFTDIGWQNLPSWDPDAKAKLALDKTKMTAARLLATQIRKEAAMLQFERDALSSLRLRKSSL